MSDHHNSLYWQGRPFLGLGASAASLAHHPDGTASRATNPRRSVAYLAGVPAEVVRYERDEFARERAWLGMRTSDGVRADELDPVLAGTLVEQGLAARIAHPEGARICPTLRGFLMADRVAAMIG